jgi:phosphatidylinositol-3-phosphatase
MARGGRALCVVLALVLAALVACRSGVTRPYVTSTEQPGRPKVMLIVEENRPYGEIIGSDKAPYLNHLASSYGLATAFDAGYSTNCPSLPAYLLLTSGSTHGICDDEDANRHRVGGPNLFAQVAASGRQWRGYAQSMPEPCYRSNDDAYVVRHAPAPYYVTAQKHCADWDVPMGTRVSGALHTDVTHGRLPAFSFVTPDVCHEMHGGVRCFGDDIRGGDTWLRNWLPMVLDGPDYRSGELTVIITWDEGSKESNHVPTIVVSPHTRHVRSAEHFTHCSVLRTTEDLLALPPLGCAATAASMRPAFHLTA